QSGERFVVPCSPCGLVAGQDRPAQGTLSLHSLLGRHRRAPPSGASVQTIVADGQHPSAGIHLEPFLSAPSPTNMSTPMLELDGSFGEGGGQILRTSLALSLITGKPFHLRNVRAKRSKPGLQPQHLMSVRAAATIGQATVRGVSKGSTDLVFEPGE